MYFQSCYNHLDDFNLSIIVIIAISNISCFIDKSNEYAKKRITYNFKLFLELEKLI